MTDAIAQIKDRLNRFIKYVDERLNAITKAINEREKDSEKEIKLLNTRITKLEKQVQQLTRLSNQNLIKARQSRHDFIDLKNKVQNQKKP